MFGNATCLTFEIQSNKTFVVLICTPGVAEPLSERVRQCVYLVTPVCRQLETTTVLTYCKTHCAEVHRRCLPHNFTLSVKQDGKEGDPGDGGKQGDWIGHC